VDVDQLSVESRDEFGLNYNHKARESNKARIRCFYRGKDSRFKRGE
jgi:hypothetical protein